MNPITREESLLDGQDLTPITRKEQFIKRIYDKTQEIPEPITREEYFLKKAGEGTSPVTIEQLNVTENGTYSETGKAYSPVIVEVPAPTLITKTITENGTYNASSDNADGYSQVTVAVEGFKKKSIANTPTDIASFNDGTVNPMPSLEISIEPVQSGSGDPSPSNVRPISGWSGANIVDCGDSSEIEYFVNLSKGIYGVVDLGSLTWSYQTSLVEGIGVFQANIIDKKAGSVTFICPLYENVITNRNLLAKNDMTMSRYNATSTVVLIRNDSYTDAIAFKTAMSGVKLIYELSEPTAPTVTPNELQAIISSYNVTSQVTTIPFHDSSDNPIIVYGGRLDVTSGELVVDRNTVIVRETDGFTEYANSFVRTSYIPTGLTVAGDDITCSHSATQYVHFSNNSKKTIEFNKAYFGAADLDAFKSLLSTWYNDGKPLQFSYKLETPITYQLTPAQVTTLLGQNNIFADCGQVLEGEYFVTL